VRVKLSICGVVGSYRDRCRGFCKTRRTSLGFFFNTEGKQRKAEKSRGGIKKEAKREKGNKLVIKKLSTHTSLESISLK
jgi:hypothetical protein